MNNDYDSLDNPDADFQAEIDDYLLKAGIDLSDPGDLHEPAIHSAIRSFDDAGREIPVWAKTFRGAK